jgi:uncharacterized protein (TIGR03437 family)
MKLRNILLLSLSAAVVTVAQTPTVVDGGVLNGASFAKQANGLGAPVAMGSLVSIFGTDLATTLAVADSVPFSTRLGGVSVKFGTKDAPLQTVIPGGLSQLNVQIPFDVLPAGQASGDVPVVVTVNGVASAPKPVSIVTSAPGVFSIPAGAGYGVLIFADSDGVAKIAAPTSANIGYPTAPIARGSNCFFYATGLGPLTPPLKEGAVDLSTLHSAVTPTVLVGGITARVDFAGAAPQFPGVYQINIGIPPNAPTGDNVTLQVRSADGSVTSSASVVISVK